MQLDNNSLIMQWNTDINGNPVSKHIAREVQQISPSHNLIQLTQIPDEFHRLRIVTEDNVELKEVKYRNDITETTFCVDYGMGLVYFDKSLSGKMVIINYYGRGVMLISDSRIFHKDGSTIADTWDNIIERSQDALDLIEHAGGLAGAIEIIDQKVEEGTQVADRLENFITETQFYGYTITLSREAFVVKADDNGEVGKTETSSVYTDVLVYKGAKQIIPTLTVSDEYGCTFKVEGQRVKLASIDVNLIKVNAILNIDCGDGLVAQRVLEVTKVFDGVNQYQVSMSNPFYSFQANSEGYIEESQSIECSFKVTKANTDYEHYTVQIQNLPQGLNYEIKKGSVVFTAISGRLLPSSGSCSVVLTIDGQSFNKPFTWNKVKQGQDAKTLTLVGNQIIRYEQPDFSDIPLLPRVTVSAKVVGLSGTPTWSFYNGTEWVVLENETALDLAFAHNDVLIWGNRREVSIKCEMEGFHDELTIVKLANGSNGNDAITVILTNESHTVAIDDGGYIESSEIQNARTNVLAYKGANSVIPIITKGGCVGCDVSIAGATVQLTSLDNSFTSSTAELLVEVDGVVVTKVWTISKSKQGLQGQNGQNGKSYILNVTGGSRSVTYSQINHDPRPSLSSTFNGALYEDGVEIVEGVSWYWIANGHFEGSSIDSNFTPTIKMVFDESVTNNSISVMATHNGQTLTQEISLSVTKDANGLDWVQEWDSTKVDVRGSLILTPKIFAGHYDQENDLITGVAIGQDVLNNGRTIGVVGYQNNVPSFLLDTDGSLQVGNPFDENSTGMYYSDGVFKLKVNELSIEGSKVPTESEIGNLVTTEVNSAKNEIQETISELTDSLGSLEDVVNNTLQDGILTEVEKQSLKTVMDTINGEVNTVITQTGSVLINPYLSNTTLMLKLEELLGNYETTHNTLVEVYVRITSTDTPTDEDVALFNATLSDLRVFSDELNQVLIDCLTDISQTQAQQLVNRAKEEIKAEVDDVNNALSDLENTINGDFKVGLVTSINLANLENHLHQLAKEKADLDSQYNVIYNNANLSTTIKSKLLQAKNNYDIAHDTLIAKINSAIADNLMTEQELQEINRLINVYIEKLGLYSGVAQEANADIALNLAQGAVQALNQEDIFNKLTNNGEVQGIYLENGKVYVNGEYINSRNLKAVRNDGTETFKIDSEGNVHIKANSFYLVGDDTNIADKDYVDNAIDSIVVDNVELTQEQVFNALTNNGQTQGVYLQNGKIYLNGEYLKAKSITADKLHADVLSANNIVSTINGGSTNISGNKIRTGVISSNNGKSTINLDSGAMNLGTTSDSSYLQWTGSALNIKANSINIGASSVATTTDVGNAKNEAINSANSNTANTLKDYYTKTQTDSQINIAKDAINLGVSSTYETKSNVSTQITSTLNSAKSYADTKKSEAISTASTDATNKVNSAKNELNTAIGKKANATDVYNKTETYTKTETDSKIKIAKDEINLGVSNTYETKTNVTTKVNQAVVDSRKIPDTRNDNQNPQWYMTNYPKQTITEFKLATTMGLSNVGTYGAVTTVVPWNNSAGGYPVQTWRSNATNATYERRGTSETAWGSWRQIEDSASSQAKANTAKNDAITSANNTLNTTIANYYTKTQTDSQINVAKNAITQSVANTYETKTDVTSKINGVNSSISSLTNRMTNAESKITDTAITNVVKQNFYTKTETDSQITSKGYQTSSQVQQTVNALQLKFTQTGGYNLLKNGKASLNTNYWVSNGGGIDRSTDSVYGTCFKTSLPSGIKYGGGAIRLKNNTHYVYEAMMYSRTALAGSTVSPLHFWCGTSASTTGTGQCTIIDYRQAVSAVNTWTKCYVHFQTKSSGEVWFTPFVYTGGSYTGDIWVTELSLSEGSIESPYSPHPNEVYDGITTIDKDGIKVSTSRGAYTHFSADGMNSYDNSNRQTLGIRNGGMTFYAYDNNEYVGYISQSVKGTSSANGVSIGISPQGEYLSLGLSSVSDPNSGFAQTSKFIIARGAIASQDMSEGLNAYAHLDMHGWNLNNVNGVNVNGGINIKNNGMIKFDSASTYASAIWEDTSSGNLAVFGDNGVVLGYKNGDTNTNILKISETADGKGCKINSYQHWNFNDWTMYNMQATYDGFTRSSADSVKMFKLSSSSESNFCVQVANDYVTYFNIQANNYVDGGKYIARFHYWNGSSAGSQGIHFYRALNMHGYNITNVGNMNVLGLMSEEVVANDIKIASPYAVMSRSGEVESLSVVKTTDDMTEHNDTVTVVNGRAEVYLPIGLAHMGYLVQATPNKLAKVAVTEKLDDHFVIEVDSNEEIAVDYCIKAFQPNYTTRVATYGELQGEESPQAITAEEAKAGKCDEVQYFNEITPLDYAGGDSLTIE